MDLELKRTNESFALIEDETYNLPKKKYDFQGSFASEKFITGVKNICDKLNSSLINEVDHFTNYISVNSNRDNLITSSLLKNNANIFNPMVISSEYSYAGNWKIERVKKIIKDTCNNCSIKCSVTNSKCCLHEGIISALNEEDDYYIVKYHAIPEGYNIKSFKNEFQDKEYYRVFVLKSPNTSIDYLLLLDPHHLAYPTLFHTKNGKSNDYKYEFGKIKKKKKDCVLESIK